MTLRRRSAGGGDDSQADRRMEQREKYPVLLGAEEKSVVPGADPVSDIRTFGFTVVGETAILLQLATESSKSEKLCFNRFERLQVFNILFYQHRPMEIDEHVEQSSGELPDDLTNEGLANLLHNYCRSGMYGSLCSSCAKSKQITAWVFERQWQLCNTRCTDPTHRVRPRTQTARAALLGLSRRFELGQDWC